MFTYFFPSRNNCLHDYDYYCNNQGNKYYQMLQRKKKEEEDLIDDCQDDYCSHAPRYHHNCISTILSSKIQTETEPWNLF